MKFPEVLATDEANRMSVINRTKDDEKDPHRQKGVNMRKSINRDGAGVTPIATALLGGGHAIS